MRFNLSLTCVCRQLRLDVHTLLTTDLDAMVGVGSIDGTTITSRRLSHRWSPHRRPS